MATLKQLKRSLRLRLGEPEEGTWGYQVDYHTNAGVSELVDEIKLAIEEAEEQITVDMHDPMGKSLLVKTHHQIPVISGRFTYQLPTDFLHVKMLQQLRDGVYYTLNPTKVALQFHGFDTKLKHDVAKVFDIQGVEPAVLGEGWASAAAASNTVLTDAAAPASFGSPTNNVDKVFNVRDDSEATITASTSTSVTGTLSGGTSNTWREGDEYKVVSGVANRQLLWIWPPISAPDASVHVENQVTATTSSTIDNSTTATASFTTTDPIVLHSVQLNLSAISTEIQPILVRIETNSGGSASGTLASTNPQSVSAITAPVVGSGDNNEAIFLPDIELAAGTYHIVPDTIETASYTWEANATDEMYSVLGATGQSSLLLSYARTPRTYSDSTTGDAETSEIPNFAKSATIYYAEYILLSKRPSNRTRALESLTLYQGEVEQIKMRLESQGETKFDSVQNVFGVDLGGGSEYFLHLDYPVSTTSI